MPLKTFSLLAGSLVILALCGCDERRDNDTDDDNWPTCPDLSGEWVMVEHCEDDLVGASYTITQTLCTLDFDGPMVENLWDADISIDGVFTSTVTTGDDDAELMHCDGEGSATEISFECDNDEGCSGRLERPE